MSQERKGDWKQTFTGRAYWPIDPRADDVDIEDIAHALGMMCRYGGHCSSFYSVAEHSVLVSEVVPREHALAGLMHDAAEAYCVDVPRPLKRHLPGYREIEDLNWRAVCQRFGLAPVLPACVHDADNAVLLAEQKVLLRPPPMAWGIPGEPAKVKIRCLGPSAAKRVFLQRFEELTK